MVGRQSICMEREGPAQSINRSNDRDGCIPSRVGGPLPGHLHGGTTVQARKHISHKLSGTFSRIPSSQVLHKEHGVLFCHG